MNLRQLQYFKVLAQLEHYTQAAEQLNIAQPSLSYAITKLEKKLGTYLFEKDGRNIQLTQYGKIYYKYVDNALKELEKGEKKIKEMMNPIQGTVDLVFVHSLGPKFIPNTLEKFGSQELNRHIDFTLSQDSSLKCIQGLKNGRVDLAFCSYIKNEPEIEFNPIGQQELVVIVSTDHPLARFDLVDLNMIKGYPFITYANKIGLRTTINQLFKDAGFMPPIVYEVEEDNTMAGLVNNNLGIAIIPKIPALQLYDIKILSIRNLTQQHTLYMCSKINHYLSPVAIKFRNFVIQNNSHKSLL